MASRALDQPPSLPPLFAKAVVTRALRRGTRTLQGTHLTLASQAIDTAHLAAYQRLCGYRVGDAVPPTYLHLLSFPLSVVRMTEADLDAKFLDLVTLRAGEAKAKQLSPLLKGLDTAANVDDVMCELELPATTIASG